MRRLASFVFCTASLALLAPTVPARAQAPYPPCVFGPVPAGQRCATASWPQPGIDAATQNDVDRAVAMMYGFNGGEARAYFQRAVERQASLGKPFAFGWWGIAVSYTIDINLPWTAQTEPLGAAAAANAVQALHGQRHPAPELVDLVNAARARYGGRACKAELNAYGAALHAAAARHRGSANYLVVAGYALLTMDNANNPDPAQQSACPRPEVRAADRTLAEEIDHADSSTPHYADVVRYMRAARALQPWNLGLHHLSIHENEYASNTQHPDRWRDAKGDADALQAYAYPDGLSHLAHMAGHIFARNGEYERTIATNTVALDNDHRYYRQGDGDGQHYLNRYHTHDLDFVLYALTTIGLNDRARAAIHGEFRPMDMPAGGRPIEQYPNGRPLLSVLLRLHDTKSLPSPHPDDAIREPWREQLASLSAARQGDAALAIEIADRSSRTILDGTLSFLVRAQLAKTGRLPAGQAAHQFGCTGELDCYAKAYELNRSAYGGDPKDYWMVPVGEGYGAALLRVNRQAEALAVFRAENARFANDPHLEWGAWQACQALAPGPSACTDTDAWQQAYRRHWKGAAELGLDDLG